jgi:hypothetical protein
MYQSENFIINANQTMASLEKQPPLSSVGHFGFIARRWPGLYASVATLGAISVAILALHTGFHIWSRSSTTVPAFFGSLPGFSSHQKSTENVNPGLEKVIASPRCVLSYRSRLSTHKQPNAVALPARLVTLQAVTCAFRAFLPVSLIQRAFNESHAYLPRLLKSNFVLHTAAG